MVVPYSTWLVAASSVVQVMVAVVSEMLEADTDEITGEVVSPTVVKEVSSE